jgi:hypothetical protein
MAKELDRVDISSEPEILDLAEDVRKSNQARLLTRDGEEFAVITPVRQPRRRDRRTGVISGHDPFVRMAGTGDSGIPAGISGRKYDYFRKAFGLEEQAG